MSFQKREGSTITLRLAVREDIEQLFALDQACFRPGIAYSKPELHYLAFHPHSRSVIAADEKGIAGFAILEIMLERGRRIGHIVTIDVAPERRRHGVGRLLMDEMFRLCREAGAALLRLEVAVDNDGALAFYRLLGFQELGRIRGFYLGKLDALQMGLEVARDGAGEPDGREATK